MKNGIGKQFLFLNLDLEPKIGKLIKEKNGTFVLELADGSLEYINDIHSELNPNNTSRLFLFHLRSEFERKLGFTVIREISHDDYLFKVVLSRPYGTLHKYFGLEKIEMAMDNVLEDFWSVLYCELKNNSIQVTHNEVIVTFRIHNLHEEEMRYNDSRLTRRDS